MPRRHRRSLLLTGSTPIQCGSKRTSLKIITAAAAWYKAFDEMGYDVDWRPVTPGEDLSRYHRTAAILHQPTSLASVHVWGAIWTMLSRLDTVVFLDDWQTGMLTSGIKTCVKSRERAFRLLKYRGPATEVAKCESELFSCLKIMSGDKWPWPVIAPILGDGDVLLLGLSTLVSPIDPTAFTDRYAVEQKQKIRRWVQASLLRKPMPKLGWPVLGFGSLDRTRGMGGIGSPGKDAQPRVPEPELMKVYAESWGVLSPAHPHAGSGWWRVRYLMAADAGCVLSADAREAACLGQAYEAASDADRVEGLSDAGLRKLARGQRQTLKKITWSRERVKDALSDLLRSCSGGDRG